MGASIKRRLSRILKLQYKPHSVKQVQLDERVLQRSKPPKDDIDRCYLHYKFMKLHYRPLQWYMTEIYAALWLPILFVKYALRARRLPSREGGGGLVVASVAVQDYHDLLPDRLVEQYGQPRASLSVRSGQFSLLTREERALLWRCFLRHPLSPKYLLNIAEGLGLYAYIVRKYAPEAVATFAGEDACRVSLLTKYCEDHGARHVNFMHGEKFYGYANAYMRLSDMYVWDKRYEELFRHSRIEAEHWYVYLPGKYAPVARTPEVVDSKIVKCYLSGEDGARLMRLHKAFGALREQGYTLILRWHPRFSNVAMIRGLFHDYELEDPREIGIEASLAGAGYVMSAYSTVLLQAKYSQIPIIVDDVSNPEMTELLTYVRFWAYDECFAKLSDMIGKGGEPA